MKNILPNTDKGLITKDNCAVAFIDHQPQMIFGVGNIDRQLLIFFFNIFNSLNLASRENLCEFAL